MKKAAILLIVAITVSSCSLFKKPSMTQEQIDSLVNQKASVEEKLVNLQHDYELLKIKADECASLMEQQTMKTVVSGTYYVVAGSFKNSTYASDYSAKVKQAGGTGNIVQGPSSFNLVVYSTHPTLREASQSMYSVRSGLSKEAWVYMKK